MKTKLKFLFTVTVCAVIGAVMSFVVGENKQNIARIANNAMGIIMNNTTAIIIIGLLMIVIANIIFLKARNDINKNAELDEYEFEKAGKTIFFAMTILDCMTPWFFLCFGLSAAYNVTYKNVDKIFIDLILFLIGYAYLMLVQYKSVELTKKLYPEKKGDIFDSKFQKDWYSSCDEAERQKIGEASYNSYRVMSIVYPFVFAFMIIVSMVYGLNPVIFIILGFMWLVHIISYLIPSYVLGYRRKKS